MGLIDALKRAKQVRQEKMVTTPVPQHTPVDDRPTIVSLFSGAGGMDLGFINAGYNIVWANDKEEAAVATYKKNIGDHIVCGDVTKMDVPKFDFPIDVVIGGFPCQAFSSNGKRLGFNDVRGTLFFECARFIKELKPKFFVLENVKGILNHDEGRTLATVVNVLQDLGYKVSFRVLNAADYGVAQRRERVFFIGNRLGVKNGFPVPQRINPKTGESGTQLEKAENVEWIEIEQ